MLSTPSPARRLRHYLSRANASDSLQSSLSMQILITTLAEYQTEFWRPFGLALRRAGHEPSFLSFDDRSTEMLKSSGLRTFSATGRPADLDVSDATLSATLARFGIDNLNYWFGHERFAFGLTDGTELRRKLVWSLQTADRALDELLRTGPVTMVQELGGFLSVIGSYFAARRHGVDNWFVEPSFFRGRLFFLLNSFAAIDVPDRFEGPVPPEVTRYLDDTVRQGAIVVPVKDRHQYTTAWKKIVNVRNAKRLLQKLVDKHIHGKTQEFGYIGGHVRTHARMLFSSLRLKRQYTPLESCGPMVYYPLHVPGDMALTLRTPHLLDQLALIDYLCRSVPHTHRIVIKEHPAMVGAIDARRVVDLLQRHDNLRLLPPATNNYAVLRRADAVVSINSKSGAEAALLGKPVLVLGDAFYRRSSLVTQVNRIQDLPAAISSALLPSEPVPAEQVLRYFAGVWQNCLPGELYVASDANVETFTRSLLEGLGRGATKGNHS